MLSRLILQTDYEEEELMNILSDLIQKITIFLLSTEHIKGTV
jgi:hypothetical protein